MCKLAKYVRNCVVFWKNLHSWQKFYTTAGRNGRDKFQVCCPEQLKPSPFSLKLENRNNMIYTLRQSDGDIMSTQGNNVGSYCFIHGGTHWRGYNDQSQTKRLLCEYTNRQYGGMDLEEIFSNKKEKQAQSNPIKSYYSWAPYALLLPRGRMEFFEDKQIFIW